VLNWLLSRMNPNDAEWLVAIRQKTGQTAAPASQVTPSTILPTPAPARIVEKTAEGTRVIIPPATNTGLDQRNSPFWAQGATMNPAALAAASINVPVVPSAVPLEAAPAAPAAPVGLSAAMFHPMPAQQAPAPQATPAPVPARSAAHMRDVVFPQIMAAKDINTCRQILAAAGLNHISHVTDANVDQVAAAVLQVTGVTV
jgi:hypothetical protein